MNFFKPAVLPKAAGDKFDSIDPLDGRYYDPEISKYLSERSRLTYQAHVEAALGFALADFGICSKEVARQIDAASRKVTAEAIYKEEQLTKHDIKALVNCIKASLPAKAKPFVHFGATSYDIVCTANALQLKTAINDLIQPRQKKLLKTLINLTSQHAESVQIGRTHGQHAVPITFGFALAEYVNRFGENMIAIEDLSNQLKGKFSGAVGAYNAISTFIDNPFEFEKTVLGYLNLEPAPYSTQIVPAENIIRLINELAITAGIMANLSHDMRHLQRSEIAEVQERFEPGQTGSSTMAHKRNPWNFENVISMSKQVTAQIVNANLNISSEHQRDLTDSASSRFYNLVLASVASMAERLNNVMSKIEINPTNMQRNLTLSGGAIAAEPLYLLLEKYGHTTAHEQAKKVAHSAMIKQIPLHQAVEQDKNLARYWGLFSTKEKRLIEAPEIFYTGQAAKKATQIARRWQKQLEEH